MDEQRKYQRVRFGFRVEDASGKKAWMTEDISPGGCFLQALEKTPVGTKINLVFQLPGSAKYIEAVGEVKNIREKGMGIEFIAMDADSKKETESFVEDYIKYQE
jgi:uncharacterized protein (TIGR02266 family)